MKRFVTISDFTDPGDAAGRSYRQVNAAKQHAIPVGALVEAGSGVRLFVVYRGRDCDMTPLYWLSPYADDTEQERPGFGNRRWIGGYAEDSLVVIGPPSVVAIDETEATP